MTAPCVLLLRASPNVEIAWPGHLLGGRVDECMDEWVDGFVATRHLCQNLMPCSHPLLPSPPSASHSPHPHPSPLLWHKMLSINGVSLG